MCLKIGGRSGGGGYCCCLRGLERVDIGSSRFVLLFVGGFECF